MTFLDRSTQELAWKTTEVVDRDELVGSAEQAHQFGGGTEGLARRVVVCFGAETPVRRARRVCPVSLRDGVPTGVRCPSALTSCTPSRPACEAMNT